MNNNYDYVLVHSGTKGMKWGKRLYQNPDGTYTALGKLRYFGQGLLGKQQGSTSGYTDKSSVTDKASYTSYRANRANASSSASSAYGSGQKARQTASKAYHTVRTAAGEAYGQARNALGGFYRGITGKDNVYAKQYGTDYENDKAARESGYNAAQNVKQKLANAKKWVSGSINQIKESFGATYNKAANFVNGFFGNGRKTTQFGDDRYNDVKATVKGYYAGSVARQKVSDLKNSASSAMKSAADWVSNTFGDVADTASKFGKGISGQNMGDVRDSNWKAGKVSYEAGKALNNAGQKIAGAVTNAAGDVADTASKFGKGVTGQNLGDVRDSNWKAEQVAYGAGKALNNAGQKIAGAVTNAAGDVADTGSKFVKGATGQNLGDVRDSNWKAEQVAYGAGKALNNIVTGAGDAIDSAGRAIKYGGKPVGNVTYNSTKPVTKAVSSGKASGDTVSNTMRAHAEQVVQENPIYQRYLNEDPNELYRTNRAVWNVLYANGQP